MVTSTIIPIPAEGPRRRTHRRWMAMGLALGFHVLVLALFLFSRPPAYVEKSAGMGDMDLSLAGLGHIAERSPRSTPSPPATPQPLAPPAPPDPIKPRSVLAIVSDILAIPLPTQSIIPTPLTPSPSPILVQAMAQAAGSPGAACDVAGAVQKVLSADPAAHSAVLLTPSAMRTAANAVLVWNGQWVSTGVVEAAPAIVALRAAVRRVVSAAGPDCRDRQIAGPRFMLIPDRDASTMVVVFGNASWRWSDLLIDPTPTREPSAYEPPSTIIRRE